MHFSHFHRENTIPPVPIYNPPPGPPPEPAPASYSGPYMTSPPFYDPPSTAPPPPEWTSTVAVVHEFGLRNAATEDECDAGEAFCNDARNAVQEFRILPSHQIEEIKRVCGKVWRMELPQTPRWDGLDAFPTVNISRWFGDVSNSGVDITTSSPCQSVCLMSNLPLIGYFYNNGSGSKGGVYYEVQVTKMMGVISIGTACKPYPSWRHPGWDRLSYALHLDDYRTFDGPYGGSDYEPLFSDGPNLSCCSAVFGCGLDFNARSIFFTYNGKRLSDMYRGIYPGVYQENRTPDSDSDSAMLPEEHYDVYAAIGVEGENKFRVNFGAERFLWAEGNEQQWKVENLIIGNELPPYSPQLIPG